eukprot:5780409-Prymnesium_polylepis.1
MFELLPCLLRLRSSDLAFAIRLGLGVCRCPLRYKIIEGRRATKKGANASLSPRSARTPPRHVTRYAMPRSLHALPSEQCAQHPPGT